MGDHGNITGGHQPKYRVLQVRRRYMMGGFEEKIAASM
jgi:hypothetical protein